MQALERWIDERVRGRRVAVLGVGNRLRGDDAAGARVTDLLGTEGEWIVIDAGTVPENYFGYLLETAPDVALFVDALDHGAAPGAWCALGGDALAARAASTHAPSLRLLAALLGRSGIECWLIGIQPQAAGLGAALSPPVAAGVRTVARALAAVRARGARAMRARGHAPVQRPAPEASHA